MSAIRCLQSLHVGHLDMRSAEVLKRKLRAGTGTLFSWRGKKKKAQKLQWPPLVSVDPVNWCLIRTLGRKGGSWLQKSPVPRWSLKKKIFLAG